MFLCGLIIYIKNIYIYNTKRKKKIYFDLHKLITKENTNPTIYPIKLPINIGRLFFCHNSSISSKVKGDPIKEPIQENHNVNLAIKS